MLKTREAKVSMNNYSLKGGRVIDPSQNLDKILDLTIVNGTVMFGSPDECLE